MNYQLSGIPSNYLAKQYRIKLYKAGKLNCPLCPYNKWDNSKHKPDYKRQKRRHH